MADLFIRRLIGVVQIYGGASGVVLGIRGLSGMRYSVPELVATLAFLGLFLWGLIAGVRLLERHAGVRSAMWFQALQIPSVLSPILAYEFVAGVDIGLHLGQVSGISYEFGADWRLVLFPRSAAWSLGVNLFPLLAASYLRFLSRR